MKCFNCAADTNHKKYEIPICHSCETGLKLFTDDTIMRQKKEYKCSEKYSSYLDEIAHRIILLENDYLKKKIKLLHVLERLANFKG
ncbi:MAG: hypothetical protein F9K09_02435 [Flavobacteriales bacterium]|nr:MAG: hypothetical protein F9K09_02435 [Flavobacteriales bacterium]